MHPGGLTGVDVREQRGIGRVVAVHRAARSGARGDIACAAVTVVDQAAQLGAARDERDAVRRSVPSASAWASVKVKKLLRPVTMPTSTSANWPSRVRVSDCLSVAQQLDRGGVAGSTWSTSRVRAAARAPTATSRSACGQRVGVGRAHRADPRRARHRRTPQNNTTSCRMPSNTNRSNVTRVISRNRLSRKSRNWRGIADLEQLGGQHQAHPAAVAHQRSCSRRRRAPRHWSTWWGASPLRRISSRAGSRCSDAQLPKRM